MNLRNKTGMTAGLLLALALLPAAHAAELKAFNASYRASYNNMAANANMSLASAGAGVRFDLPLDLEGGFAVAFPLTRDVATENDKDPRFYVNLSKKF